MNLFRIKLALDVFDLVLKVNGGFAVRDSKGHPTGFFDYSGHTNTLYVSIHPDGWHAENGETSECDRFAFDFDKTDEELAETFICLNRYVSEMKLEEVIE